uniref:Actinodin3 n=3 Tax=Astyanax mexicanus TaxID=7994 RepID=A0A3B1JZX7_ASTMX
MKVSKMSLSMPVALSCILMLPTLLQAVSLTKLPDKAEVSGSSGNAVSIDAAQAHNFLTHSRPRREADPKWYRKDPDFQSYYRYYSSIGHMEGLYEVDKIRMLYQQMRHLENTYGPDASKYQTILGLHLPKNTPPPPTTKPTPPPTTPPPALPPLSQSDVTYLCNPKDPLCKPRIVYLPTGAVPVLCDPRYNPACKLTAAKEPPPAPAEPAAPAPPPAKKSNVPPAPPPLVFKEMEYDCDPYWDPDCLIDNPPRPVKVKGPVLAMPPKTPAAQKEGKVEEEEEEEEASKEESKGTAVGPNLYYDPYDYRRDLYDPYHYANPPANPQ